MGELTIVRQQEGAGRVRIEPADRDDARRVSDEFGDSRPPAGVAQGRDDTRRLVQQHVGELVEPQRPPVELDPVAGGDEGVQRPRLAVDGDPSGLDQLVGATARGDACPGEPGVQPHRGQ